MPEQSASRRKSLQPYQIGIETLVGPGDAEVAEAFNRTRLELKHHIMTRGYDHYEAFNRTRLELKRCYGCNKTRYRYAFNRTRLELKRQGIDTTQGSQ